MGYLMDVLPQQLHQVCSSTTQRHIACGQWLWLVRFVLIKARSSPTEHLGLHATEEATTTSIGCWREGWGGAPEGRVCLWRRVSTMATIV